MNIPSFGNYPFVDKNGNLTDTALRYLDELNRSMQGALSDNGFTTPAISSQEINNVKQDMPDGTSWYNNDTNKLTVKINGELHEVDTTPVP